MSQRQMAAVMGVSPRTVGRWLREGTSEGIRKIPREARDLINIAFEIHKDLARDAAKRFEIPFQGDFPVYAVRKPLPETRRVIDRETGVIYNKPTGRPKLDPATGLPILGDRIYIENAQFFSSEMRQIVILDFALTGKMVVASVGSRVNLYRYYQETLAQRLDEQRRSTKRGKATPGEVRQAMRDSFESTFGIDVKELEQSTEIKDIYTRKRVIAPGFNQVAEIKDIENHIRQKHEPAAGEKGTAIGHTIIVQMMRESTNEANARIAAREAAKNRRGKRKT